MKKIKTIAFTLFALLTGSSLFAQTGEENWNVYDIQTGQETVTDLSSVMVPKAIVGRDDRINITGRAANFEKSGVVLEMTRRDGRGGYSCSGAMIGPNIVLTAAHCLTVGGQYFSSVQVFAAGVTENGNGQYSPFETNPIRPNRPPEEINNRENITRLIRNYLGNRKVAPQIEQLLNNKMTFAAKGRIENFLAASRPRIPSAKATKLWVPQEWRRATNGNNSGTVNLDTMEPYDYGIVVLDKNIGEKTGWMKIANKSTRELKHKNIILLGRGGDKPSRTLWSAKGSVGKVDKLYLYHDADMVGGNSGGPVVLEKDPYTIVALNNFGPIKDTSREGTFPNGCLRISNKIINAVKHITK